MMATESVNLYLVGFMGTGKTTVGRGVAARLGYVFVDSDHEIERLHGKTVAEIFAQDGEAAFRSYEKDFIERGHPGTSQVVACGGGLIIPPGMLELVMSKGIVVCLHASVQTILERTLRNRTRPLLDVADPTERIQTLFAEREPIYRRAGTAILTEGRPVADIVSHVLRVYQREVKGFDPGKVAAS
jgi:shikimate kinase